MILTPEEQARIAELQWRITERVAALKGLRAEKRRIKMAGYQRAHRAKAKGE